MPEREQTFEDYYKSGDIGSFVTTTKSKLGSEGANYFQSKTKTPRVDVVLSSTNEPMLHDTLVAWATQTINDIQVNVVVDCANDDSWRTCHDFQDPRFNFEFSDSLRGLAWVWNRAAHMSKAPYMCFTVGDIIPPSTFLEEALRVVDAHGWVIPSSNEARDDPLWCHVVTHQSFKAIGEFDAGYGPGSVLPMEWRTRASECGYAGVKLCNINIPSMGYSILDKIPFEDAEPCIANGLWRKRYDAFVKMREGIVRHGA